MLLFSQDYFFTFGSTKTYSRVVKFALSRSSLVIFVLYKVNIIQWMIPCIFTKYKYMCYWAAQKQSRPQTDLSILPICIDTHGQYTTPTCPKCANKILEIFLRVLEFALAEFCAKYAKINVPRIFPFLQYIGNITKVFCKTHLDTLTQWKTGVTVIFVFL